MKRHVCVCLRAGALFAFILLCKPVEADLIDIPLLDHPDVFSGFIDVTYDAATDRFIADGFALTFDDDGVGTPENISSGGFNITATINEFGKATGGTLTIEGDVLGVGPSLLTADLADFGFQDPPGGDLFDFLFSTTGGSLADAYFGGIGAPVGVILDANCSTFNGFFDRDFDNLINGIPGTGFGLSDTGVPVPEPASTILGLLGLGLVAMRRGRPDAD